MTIRLGPDPDVMSDGRHVGTLIGPEAATVAALMQAGTTFSGIISAFDPTSGEGEVGLLGTPPHAA